MNPTTARTTTTWGLTPSPIGELLLLADDEGRLTGLYVDGEARRTRARPALAP